MEVNAYFENIKSVLIDEIAQAKERIYVAVAWFTDTDLLNALVERTENGVHVKLLLLDDEINAERGVDVTLLEKNSDVFLIPSVSGESIMHNKFCVIDSKTAISGSYNWTRRAQHNDENITVIKGDYQTCFQFISQFNRLVEKYHGGQEEEPLDTGKVVKRLELIKNLIALEEESEIPKHVAKLEAIDGSGELAQLTRLLRSEQWIEGLAVINELLKNLSQLIIYTDPRVAAVKLELKNLEIQIIALREEMVETEKLINQFLIAHNSSLGQLILEILRIKKDRLNEMDSSEFESEREEANRDYDEYRDQAEEISHLDIQELNEQEERELKKMYKQAAMLCHPDKVNEELKTQAELIFKELNEANSKNDIARVKEILDDLKNNRFTSRTDEINEYQQLISRKTSLERKRNQLLHELREMKEAKTYQTILDIDDWNAYFNSTKEALEKELELLKTTPTAI